MRKAVIAVTLAGLAGSIVATHPREAEAQVVNSISPTGKGMVGCGLIGAETVALIEAAAGVRARWAYAVFPLLGAAGGVAGGYFLEQAANSSTPPDGTLTGVAVASLVVGLGLVIPTTIAFVSATSYHPENEPTNEDNAPSNVPLEESGSPGTPGRAGTASTGAGAVAEPAPASGPSPAAAPTGSGLTAPVPGGNHGPSSSVAPHRVVGRALAMGRPSLLPGILNVGSGGVSMGVPAVGVSNGYSPTEMRQYGVAPLTEVRVPLLSGTF